MSVKAKKSLGQHFLTDTNMILKIVDAVSADKNQTVIEIGPGTGAITSYLLERYSAFKAIEVDQRAIDYLKAKYPNIEIIHQDVLKVDWNAIYEAQEEQNPIYVVGNLPYYITSPILFSLVEARECFSEAVVMMQKEVAERIIAKPRTKAYGVLSVQLQILCTPTYGFDVPPGVFSPPPKVDSAVLNMKFDKGDIGVGYQEFKTVVRTAFNQRRKKLSNSLKGILNGFEPQGFDLTKRPEELYPQEYVELAQCLVENDIL